MMTDVGSSVSAARSARPVADDLFFIVFDEYGHGRCTARVAGLALAGGLLCELALSGRLSLTGGRLLLAQRGGSPSDALSHLVFDVMASSAHTDARVWLAFWAQRAAGDVAERLQRAGLLTRGRQTRGRGRAGWLPVDRSSAAWPLIRLRVFLRDRQQFTWPDVVLLGLCAAAGLRPEVLRDGGAQARDYAEHLRKELERDMPVVADLIAQTEAAVGDAVLHHRT